MGNLTIRIDGAAASNRDIPAPRHLQKRRHLRRAAPLRWLGAVEAERPPVGRAPRDDERPGLQQRHAVVALRGPETTVLGC